MTIFFSVVDGKEEADKIRGKARHDMARQGMTWQGKAKQSKAKHALWYVYGETWNE